MLSILGNKVVVIAISLIALVGASVGALASMGYGPFAYISYSVSGQQGTEIIPVHFDLGNLTAGQQGNVTGNATITIMQTGNYTIKLLHVEKLEKVFSYFNVTLKINNNTYLVNLEKSSTNLTLNNGTYQVEITIFYKVSLNPKAEDIKNEPLLVIHPSDEEGED